MCLLWSEFSILVLTTPTTGTFVINILHSKHFLKGQSSCLPSKKAQIEGKNVQGCGQKKITEILSKQATEFAAD